MSKATKRKHVTKEVLDQYVLPEGDRQIVKVLSSRGNNLHEVETPSGEMFLASMPTKFRKNVWIKRGDFVMVEPIEEGDKVKAEISHILYKDQIKFIKEEHCWPDQFEDLNKLTDSKNPMIPDDMLPPSDDDDDDVGSGDDVYGDDHQHSRTFANPNRRVIVNSDYGSDEEESDKDH